MSHCCPGLGMVESRRQTLRSTQTLVATPSPRPSFGSIHSPGRPTPGPGRRPRRDRSPSAPPAQPLELIQGSLSPRRIERQAPWLASLHRAADGTLAGLGVCMLGLSALTLHWQHRWAESYRDLEVAQVLSQRMQESGALLEQHHIGTVRRPGGLEPTSISRLVYLPAPSQASNPRLPAPATSLQLRQIRTGY
jgi:hypothetical protein